MYRKYFLAWLPMILIGIANGILREVLMTYRLGDGPAHQISTVTLFVFLGLYIWYILPKTGIRSSRQSWIGGVIWLILTVLFEFGLGYFAGQSIPELLNAYNIFEGRLWVIIPLWVGIAPRIFFLLNQQFDDTLDE